MRRVNVITGIKQRLNDIFGNCDSSSTTGDLTAWSIQSAMLSNLTVMAKALAGENPYGRVLKGMVVTQVSGNDYSISPGIAITPSGGIVNLQVAVTFSIGGVDDTPYYVFAKHSIVKLDSSSYPGYKSTSIINGSGMYDIVYDEVGTAHGTSVTKEEILSISTTDHSGDSDSTEAKVATIVLTAGVPAITATSYKGFVGTNLSIPGTLGVAGTVSLDGALNVAGAAQFGSAGVDGAFSVNGQTSLNQCQANDDITFSGNGKGITLRSASGTVRKVTLNDAGNGFIFT